MLPISDKTSEYAQQVYRKLRESGVRCEYDDRPEKIGYKIREAQMEKVPYMVITGAQEAENGTVAIRYRDSGENVTMTLEEFIAKVKEETRTRKSN